MAGRGTSRRWPNPVRAGGHRVPPQSPGLSKPPAKELSLGLQRDREQGVDRRCPHGMDVSAPWSARRREPASRGCRCRIHHRVLGKGRRSRAAHSVSGGTCRQTRIFCRIDRGRRPMDAAWRDGSGDTCPMGVSLAVAICTHNRPAQLKRALDSVVVPGSGSARDHRGGQRAKGRLGLRVSCAIFPRSVCAGAGSGARFRPKPRSAWRPRTWWRSSTTMPWQRRAGRRRFAEAFEASPKLAICTGRVEALRRDTRESGCSRRTAAFPAA